MIEKLERTVQQKLKEGDRVLLWVERVFGVPVSGYVTAVKEKEGTVTVQVDWQGLRWKEYRVPLYRILCQAPGCRAGYYSDHVTPCPVCKGTGHKG